MANPRVSLGVSLLCGGGVSSSPSQAFSCGLGHTNVELLEVPEIVQTMDELKFRGLQTCEKV